MPKSFVCRLIFIFALPVAWLATNAEAATACVWKVSAPNGGTLYLGGSVHALRSTDYPLPAAFNRAFDACTRLAFEVDQKALAASSKRLVKAGQYPKGDSLRNHVDPRTYDYVRRVFALMKVPEEKFSKFRPWFLVLSLQAPELRGFSEDLGVERFLAKRAAANSKPVSGLESMGEHMKVFSGLNDRQSEALLLLMFIPSEVGSADSTRVLNAWRRGDAETLERVTRESFRDFPSLGERVLGARNRTWIPKIDRYLRSGQTYFVVVGAAHMGGRDGLLSLLRARGCRVEQL